MQATSVVLVAREICSLKLSGKTEMLRNKMLKRIFGPEKDEVKFGYGKLHNEEFHNLHSSINNTTTIKQGT
jgi:hypothetical protein